MKRFAAWCVAAAIVLAPVTAVAKPAPPPDEADWSRPPPPPPPDFEQPPPPSPEVAPESPYRRSTWFFGFGLGAGTFNYENADDSYGGVIMDFHLGGMLTERVALLVRLSVDNHKIDDFSETEATMGTFGISGQYWFTPKMWGSGGIGTSSWVLKQFDDAADPVKGRSVALGAGYEVIQRKKLVLDLELRLMATQLDDGSGFENNRVALGLLAKLTWY